MPHAKVKADAGHFKIVPLTRKLKQCGFVNFHLSFWKLQITPGSSTFNPVLRELCFVHIRVSADWISWSRYKFPYQDDVTYFTVGSSNYFLYLVGIPKLEKSLIQHLNSCMDAQHRIKYPQRSFLYTLKPYTEVN